MRNTISQATERNISKKSRLHSKFLESLEAELNEDFSAERRKSVNLALENAESFVLVEEVKTAIYQLIYFSEQISEPNIPDYISTEVNGDFVYLNQCFLMSTGLSIKRYINKQKIELVKDLLTYGELKLTQIVSTLHYRNVAHLVNEFIKATGVSPDFYRLLRKTSLGKSRNVRIV